MKSPVASARRKRLSYIFFAFWAVFFLLFRPALLSSNDISPLDDEFFEKASIAYKNGEFMLAFDIFSGLAEKGIHDAQYNLAVILKSGKGVPKDYIQALFWSWRARLGGIELAVDQSEELMDLVPEKSLKDLRESVRETLRSRVFDGDSAAISRLANYFLIIPDKRYCFDALLPVSSISKIIEYHIEKKIIHAPSSILEHRALTTHNDPIRHWKGDNNNDYDIVERLRYAIKEIKNNPKKYIDVHSWQFTPKSFCNILELLYSLKYTKLRIERCYPTILNSNEFFVILKN